MAYNMTFPTYEEMCDEYARPWREVYTVGSKLNEKFIAFDGEKWSGFGTISAAARFIGVNKKSVYYYLDRYGIYEKDEKKVLTEEEF